MKMRRLILPFCIITVLCIGAVELFYRFALPSLLRSLLTPAVTDGPGQGLQEGKSGKARNYQVILERNLFGRGPAGLDPGGNKSDPLAGLTASSLDLILLGTVSGDSQDQRAVIMDRESKKQGIYHIGDSVQGAVIKDIFRGKVVVRFRGGDELLDMTEARQYFAETGAVPVPPHLQRNTDAPNEAMPSLPIGTGARLAPPLREFSPGAGAK
jgi:type II secretory pathway component PulC